MNRNNIQIWDNIYPCEFFADDIENNCPYLLVEDNDDIVAAFALSESNNGENNIKCENVIDDFVLLEYGFEIEV